MKYAQKDSEAGREGFGLDFLALLDKNCQSSHSPQKLSEEIQRAVKNCRKGVFGRRRSQARWLMHLSCPPADEKGKIFVLGKSKT